MDPERPDRPGRGGRMSPPAAFVAISVGLVLSVLAFVTCTRQEPPASSPAVPAVVSTPSWCEATGDAEACLSRECGANARTLVDIGAEWCPYCTQLREVTFADPRVVGRLSRMGLVHIDGDDAPAAARRFGARSYPTLVILDRNCAEIARMTGFRDADTFLRELDALPSR